MEKAAAPEQSQEFRMSAHPVNWPTPLRVRVTGTSKERVVICSGRLTAEVTATFKEEVKRLLPVSHCVVLDLSELNYMDSSGLGAIVGLYVSAKSANCELRLINLGKRVYELLCISNVVSIFGDCARYNTKFP
jgi:anti-sigma B factor antagonist